MFGNVDIDEKLLKQVKDEMIKLCNRDIPDSEGIDSYI